MRRPIQERETLLEAAQRAQTKADIQKEVRVVGQTIWDEAVAEGEQKGEQKGELKGELKAMRRNLRQLLEARFGRASEAVLQRIESTTDVERLAAAIVKVLDISAPEDLPI